MRSNCHYETDHEAFPHSAYRVRGWGDGIAFYDRGSCPVRCNRWIIVDRATGRSVLEAGRTLRARADYDPYYPCVSDDLTEMHLYRGGEYHENGPDVVLTLGPRGGVRRA